MLEDQISNHKILYAEQLLLNCTYNYLCVYQIYYNN